VILNYCDCRSQLGKWAWSRFHGVFSVVCTWRKVHHVYIFSVRNWQ